MSVARKQTKVASTSRTGTNGAPVPSPVRVGALVVAKTVIEDEGTEVARDRDTGLIVGLDPMGGTWPMVLWFRTERVSAATADVEFDVVMVPAYSI